MAPPLPPRPDASSTSSRTLPLLRNRQTEVPFSAPINGLHMYTKHDPIRGELNGFSPLIEFSHARQVLGHLILLPSRCPSRASYKCSSMVNQERRRRGSVAPAPRRRRLPLQSLLLVTAAYKQSSASSETRNSVQLRGFARSRAVVISSSIWSAIKLSILFCRSDPVQVSTAPMRTVHVDAYSRKGALGLSYLTSAFSMPRCGMTLKLTV